MIACYEVRSFYSLTCNVLAAFLLCMGASSRVQIMLHFRFAYLGILFHLQGSRTYLPFCYCHRFQPPRGCRRFRHLRRGKYQDGNQNSQVVVIAGGDEPRVPDTPVPENMWNKDDGFRGLLPVTEQHICALNLTVNQMLRQTRFQVSKYVA